MAVLSALSVTGSSAGSVGGGPKLGCPGGGSVPIPARLCCGFLPLCGCPPVLLLVLTCGVVVMRGVGIPSPSDFLSGDASCRVGPRSRCLRCLRCSLRLLCSQRTSWELSFLSCRGSSRSKRSSSRSSWGARWVSVSALGVGFPRAGASSSRTSLRSSSCVSSRDGFVLFGDLSSRGFGPGLVVGRPCRGVVTSSRRVGNSLCGGGPRGGGPRGLSAGRGPVR